MMSLDKQRIAAVTTLEAMGFTWGEGKWVPPGHWDFGRGGMRASGTVALRSYSYGAAHRGGPTHVDRASPGGQL